MGDDYQDITRLESYFIPFERLQYLVVLSWIEVTCLSKRLFIFPCLRENTSLIFWKNLVCGVKIY